LDDFVCHERFEPLTQVADIIKVDFRSTEIAQQEALATRFGLRGIKMLAEKVETQEEFERASRAGYAYFQGYFFAKPAVLKGREVPSYKLHSLQVLEVIHSPSLDFGKLENLIKQDVSLAYKLLRYINAARFGCRQKIESIKHALVLLGESEIRRWASLAILSGMCEDKPRELLLSAAIRARFCELVGGAAGVADRRSDLFLTGMFSFLDAIMDLPLEEVLSKINVHEDVRRILLRTGPVTGRMPAVYDAVRAYQAADWPTLSALAGQLRLEEELMPELYFQAVQWAEEIFRAK
jgi:EAL and modified HD-GYP domain-containing signal transduction protein